MMKKHAFSAHPSLHLFETEEKKAITAYETNVIAKKESNPKLFYRYVAKKDKYGDKSIFLMAEGDVISEQSRFADLLNIYLSSVFTNGPSNLNAFNNEPLVTCRSRDIDITEEQVRGKWCSLDIKNSCRPDGIPAIVLAKCVDFFTPITTKFFRLSYENGIIPPEHRGANVVPIHKSSSKNNPNNYRPVSLTPIISKIFEGLIKDDLEEFVESNNIIWDNQHGFRKGKYTCTNLLEYWHELSDLVDKSQSVFVLYTDFKKAFDSVPHDLLLQKLRLYGINGRTLAWLQNFLKNRAQRVIINGVSSSTSEVAGGVPQGGVLSGLLFSIHMNDLPREFSFAQISI